MPDIGRWGNIDNLAEKYNSISPYHYAGNNPVLYLDLDGNSFTPLAQTWVDRLISQINSKQEKNNSDIQKYKADIAAGGSKKEIAKWNKKINELTDINSELEATRAEVGILAGSNQLYNVIESNNLNDSDYTTAGTGFNFSSGIVSIVMPRFGGLSLFAHEMKHAYQFEIGEFAFLTKESIQKGTLFINDKTDEVLR